MSEGPARQWLPSLKVVSGTSCPSGGERVGGNKYSEHLFFQSPLPSSSGLFVLSVHYILFKWAHLLCIGWKEEKMPLPHMVVCLKAENEYFHPIVTKMVEQKSGGLVLFVCVCVCGRIMTDL